MQDLHGDALDKIVGDMDDMETGKMFPAGGGATITITVTPPGGGEGAAPMPGEEEGESNPEGLPADMPMADGGQVPMPAMPEEEDESGLPPFLRKKKAV